MLNNRDYGIFLKDLKIIGELYRSEGIKKCIPNVPLLIDNCYLSIAN